MVNFMGLAAIVNEIGDNTEPICAGPVANCTDFFTLEQWQLMDPFRVMLLHADAFAS